MRPKDRSTRVNPGVVISSDIARVVGVPIERPQVVADAADSLGCNWNGSSARILSGERLHSQSARLPLSIRSCRVRQNRHPFSLCLALTA